MASRGVNRATVMGNLGADPDVRMMPDGSPVVTISLATSEVWKDKQTGEKKERTDWHRVVFFRKAAEIIGQYCKKGSKLYVEGRMQTRDWEDDKGIKRYITEIIASDFQLIGSSDNSGNRPPPLGEKMPAGQASTASSAPQKDHNATAPASQDTAPPHYEVPPGGSQESDFDEQIPF